MTYSQRFEVIKWKSRKSTKSILITHKYMITHFPGLVQVFQWKW